MNIYEKIAILDETIKAVYKQGKEIITELCVEWLNSKEAVAAGVDKVVFGGATPSFNDGEPCTFSLHSPFATNVEVDLIESPDCDNLEIDEDVAPGVVAFDKYNANEYSVPGFLKLCDALTTLEDIGILVKVFNEYGFVAIVHRNGTLVEKEYDCGY